MISEISLKNFKCFNKINVPMKNVTVLTGINGMGKSTVIQSILLLRQSYLKDEQIQSLYLNGKYVELGNSQDVLYEKADEEKISIGYMDQVEGEGKYTFKYWIDSDSLPLIERVVKGEMATFLRKRFTYLSAYRIKPQEMYRVTNEEELVRREFGNSGEYALQYLGLFGNEEVENKSVIIQDKLGNTLKNQTRMWLDRIAPGVSPQIFLNMTLRTSEIWYEFIEGKEKTNSYKSVNVGFGITYVIPVIIALISAREGDVVIIENPEAHIHPAGQRMLGELISLAGAGGVQVILETHSDHILNGIRIAVKQKKIKKEEVQINFFYKDEEQQYQHNFITPHILDDGRLDVWPEGFFDEWDKALYDLI